MLFLLAGNPVTGIRDPTMEMLYPAVAAAATVLAVVLLWWLARRLVQRSRARRASWATFDRIAKVRRLTPFEAKTLAELVRRAKSKRPTQILGSVQLFDRCVEQVLRKGDLTVGQQAVLEVVRRKLMATVVQWNGVNRRQLERLESIKLAVQIAFITRQAVDDELKGSVTEGDARYLETLNALLATASAMRGEVTTLSAGGASVVAPRSAPAREGDYAMCRVDASKLGVDLNNLATQVMACTDHATPGLRVFHLCFLPYPAERRRDVIRFVYRTATPGEAPAAPSASPAATATAPADGAAPASPAAAAARPPAPAPAGTPSTGGTASPGGRPEPSAAAAQRRPTRPAPEGRDPAGRTRPAPAGAASPPKATAPPAPARPASGGPPAPPSP